MLPSNYVSKLRLKTLQDRTKNIDNLLPKPKGIIISPEETYISKETPR